MFCTNCGANIEKDSRFCTKCGAAVTEDDPSLFGDGQSVDLQEDSGQPLVYGQPEDTEQPLIFGQPEDIEPPLVYGQSGDYEQPPVPSGHPMDYDPFVLAYAEGGEAAAPAKKINKKLIVIGASALVVVIIALVLIFTLGRGGNKSPLLYRKGSELMAYQTGAASFLISDDFEEGGSVSLTEDGKTLFYTDNYQYSDGYPTYSLYYRDVQNPQSRIKGADTEKGLLLSKDVYSYRAAGSTVVYIKGMSSSGGKLRYHNLKEEVTIDSGVTSVRLSQDGKKLVYLKEKSGSYDLYEVYLSKPDEKTKIASGVSTIIGVDTDAYATYAYLKQGDDGLYTAYLVRSSESTKILSGVSTWQWIDDDLFFLKEDYKKFGLTDVVIDDMPADDYDAEYIRDEAEEYPYEVVMYDIYMLKGSEAVKIAEGTDGSISGGDGYIVYFCDDYDSLEKPKLSDLIDEGYWYWSYICYNYLDYEVEGAAYAMKLGEANGYVIFSAEEVEEIYSVDYDASSGYLYYIDEYDYDKEEGRLMRAKLGADKLGETESIASDVNYFRVSPSGELFYVTDERNDEGALYILKGKDGVKVSEDVYYVSFLTYDEQSVTVVWTDYKSGDATLNVWKSGELIKVDEDVYIYGTYYKGSGGLFYLRDYRQSRSKGDLYYWAMKGQPVLIDDDVSEIVG